MAPDSTTFGDCLEIIQRLQIAEQLPPAVERRLQLGAAGRIDETPKKDDRIFGKINNLLVGNNSQACTAAAQAAKNLGYSVMILTSRLEGDNEEAARFHMSIAGEIVSRDRPLRRPACIISGGETTVKVKGTGKGGRNQEFALHCVRSLARFPSPCIVASLGTDGTDGPTDAAGAIADNTTMTRSLKHGAQFLSRSINNNNSYHFFKSLGDLITTGPTRTNVMDLHLVLLG
jgi:hydroxypyruvate reductase